MSVAIVAGAAVAAGGEAYAANQQSKSADKAMQNQRDMSQEMPPLLKQFAALNNKTTIADYQRAQLQQGLQGDFAKQVLDMYPGIARAERQATSDQRGGDLQDLRRFGGKLMQALDKAQPGFLSSLGALNQRVASAGERTGLLGMLNLQAMDAGPSDIRAELDRQAQSDLALGGALSPEEERMATQAARQGWADRGLMGSNPAVVQEALNRDSLSRQRQAERRSFASAVLNQGMAEDAQNRSFMLGTEGQNQAATNAERGFVSQAVGINQQALSPLLQFLQSRAVVSPAMGAQMMSAAPNTQGQSQGLLAQLLGYGQDAANTNFNAMESRNNSAANNSAALTGAAINSGTQLLGTAATAYAGRGPTIPNGGNVAGYTYNPGTGYRAV
jgi:hypothetical protein